MDSKIEGIYDGTRRVAVTNYSRLDKTANNEKPWKIWKQTPEQILNVSFINLEVFAFISFCQSVSYTNKLSVWSILRKEFFSQKQLLNAFLKILRRTRFPNFVFKEAPTAQKRNFCLILIIRSRFENFIMLSTSWLKAFFSIPINETKKDWHSHTFFRTIQIN